ncbi:hypothetical protein [Listeria booriae]|uniref:Uncharacterized protein n=1 Tax=Listeria booriae TaxID=1552123 RepID=A0A841Y3D7_9LIST|nr:hypothetical protein [Listeria booriae]MBC1318488.1 hypothetical protein [Listeria booriae]MBC2388797.1 hypothetical protein [Listeria booriae]
MSKRKKAGILIGLLFLVLGSGFTGYMLHEGQQEAPETAKKENADEKQATQKKTILDVKGTKGTTEETRPSIAEEEKIVAKDIQAVNQRLVDAYFSYKSTQEQFQHIMPLATKAFQQKMQEAAGIGGEAVKSRIIKRQAFWNDDRSLHPEMTNLITQRVAVNGSEYEQTSYMRIVFEKEENQWKMADMAITLVGSTQKGS